MELTNEIIHNLSYTINLKIPKEDLNTIRIRLSSLLSAMEEIEKELGADLHKVEPIPPVFPQEDF